MKGRRNLKIRVTDKGREVKNEKDDFPAEKRKKETMDEMMIRWAKADEELHNSMTQGVNSEGK